MTKSPIHSFCLALLIVSLAAAVEPGQPSMTALSAEIQRAVGFKNPDPALRNPDYFAEKFIGPRERAAFKSALASLPNLPPGALDLDWDAMVERFVGKAGLDRHTARTKYFDDALLTALGDGDSQVVILGAGFDSRAYRFQGALGGVRFFEVDYGPTQEYKKLRLKEILGSVPTYVRFVAMDFTKDDLLTELRKAGYSERERSLFVWEGVIGYLTETAVKDTLHFVRDHAAAGSTLAFNYTLSGDPAVNNPHTHYALWGEPRLFALPGANAGDFLRREGLETFSDVSLTDLLKKYGLPIAESDGRDRRFCLARVAAKPGSARSR